MTEISYLRGAFIAYEPEGYPNAKRVIPFRFNPESLSRSVAVEAGQTGGGVEGAAPGASAEPAAEASADASSGSLKESFSVVIRLDFADREESLSGLDEKLGIAPEIAAIEDLLYPAETESEASSDGSEPVRPAPERPTVLFVWGHKRVLPVRIASLKIDESVYNAELNPVRAEIEASLEVLGEAEARNHAAVRPALDHTHNARRELARMFYDNTSSQSTNVPPAWR
jgi:Contractile injection system tube protein